MQPIDVSKKLSKLHWAVRRGMLELDVLLGNFLKEVYPSACQADKALFSTLLTFSDPDIYAWVMGYQEASDPGIQKITKAIRNHARSRIHT